MRIFFILQLIVLVFSALLALSPSYASAAVMFAHPTLTERQAGETFTVDIGIDSGGTTINAAQAVINFPREIIEIESLDTGNSVFSFWMTEPTYSNENGTLSFIGGTTKGITGASLRILSVTFKAKEAGVGDIAISDAVITANDGKGSNVFSVAHDAAIGIGQRPEVRNAPTVFLAPLHKPAIIEEQPKLVERATVPVKKLPLAPALRVPLYVDESAWHNYDGDVIVLWYMPDDVTQIASIISQDKTAAPKPETGGLYTGKNLGVISRDGIWYVRVRFKNSVGWGPTTTYMLRVDTAAPMPFSSSVDPVVSDNPSPKVSFRTSDALSGLDRYEVFVDDVLATTTQETTITLQPQRPGKHKIAVRAYDIAGNGIEDMVSFEVLPLESPTIDFIALSMTPERPFVVTGHAVPGGTVDVRVRNTRGDQVFIQSVVTDDAGAWQAAVDAGLPYGAYTLDLVVRDERGASSVPTERVAFKSRGTTVVSIGLLEFGRLELGFGATVVILIVGWVLLARRASRVHKQEICQDTARDDVVDIEHELEEDISSLEQGLAKMNPRSAAAVTMKGLLAALENTVRKLKDYLAR